MMSAGCSMMSGSRGIDGEFCGSSVKNFLYFLGIFSIRRQGGRISDSICHLIGASSRIIGANVSISLVEVKALLPFILCPMDSKQVSTVSL